MSGRKILFVVNPAAGKRRNLDLKEFIEENFNFPHYAVDVSTSLDYFEEIKEKALVEGYTDVVACGGDGTVNKVAAFVCQHNLRLGILPLGSGNGLARSVKVSMDLRKALKQIENGKVTVVDAGVLNDKLFFCAAGMGFDAHIAALFEKTEARGLWGYFKLIWREFFSYVPQQYALTFDGHSINTGAFLLALCNSGQYGNDFYIAPTAIMNDGMITVSVLKPFSKWKVPFIVIKVIFRQAHKLNCVETYHTPALRILRKNKGSVHLDGEPHEEGAEINLSVRPMALQILAG